MLGGTECSLMLIVQVKGILNDELRASFTHLLGIKGDVTFQINTQTLPGISDCYGNMQSSLLKIAQRVMNV